MNKTDFFYLDEDMLIKNSMQKVTDTKILYGIYVVDMLVGEVVIDLSDEKQILVEDICIYDEYNGFVYENQIVNAMFKKATELGIGLSIKMSNTKATRFFNNEMLWRCPRFRV